MHGEVRNSLDTLAWWRSDVQAAHVVGDGTTGRCGEVNGETCTVGELCRSQSLHSTVAGRPAEGAKSKVAAREGRQEGGSVSFTTKQSESKAPVVPQLATQGEEVHVRDWTWVQASVWNERMLAALDNGVRGEKWFSLIDKVYRAETLKKAWQKVAANGGAAGVDGQSIKRFAARAETYLEELSIALKSGTHKPQAIRRVEITKGGGKLRP